jgi:hypothetical protein
MMTIFPRECDDDRRLPTESSPYLGEDAMTGNPDPGTVYSG